MSIVDYNVSYSTTMEKSSSPLSGKFFWFSGYYNIGDKHKPAYNEPVIIKKKPPNDGASECKVLPGKAAQQPASDDVIRPSKASTIGFQPTGLADSDLKTLQIHTSPTSTTMPSNQVNVENNKSVHANQLWFRYVDTAKPSGNTRLNPTPVASSDIGQESSHLTPKVDSSKCECPKVSSPTGVYFKLHTSLIPDSNQKAQYSYQPSSTKSPPSLTQSNKQTKDRDPYHVDHQMLSSIDDIDVNSRTSCPDTVENVKPFDEKENISPLTVDSTDDDIERRKKNSKGTFFKLQVSCDNIRAPEKSAPSIVDNTSSDETKAAPLENIGHLTLASDSILDGNDLLGYGSKDETLVKDDAGIGTWFGFSGRTYRAKPMQHLEIDSLAKNDLPLNYTPTKDPNHNDTKDFRDESISSLVSEISDDNECSITDVGYDTDLTLVTPIKNPDSSDLLKGFEEPMEDEVFVSSRVSEIVSKFNYDNQNINYSDNKKSSIRNNNISSGKYSNSNILACASDRSFSDIPWKPDGFVHNAQVSSVPPLVREEAIRCIDIPNMNASVDPNNVSMDNDSSSDTTIQDTGRSPPSLLHEQGNDQHFINAYLKDCSEVKEYDHLDLNNSYGLHAPHEPSSREDKDEEEMKEIDEEESSMILRMRVGEGDGTALADLDDDTTSATPLSPSIAVPSRHTLKCSEAKELLTYLDTILINDDTFGRDFEVVKKLHALFWELRDESKSKDASEEKKNEARETLSVVLNYMVVQEWPKVFVGVFKKLKMTFPHVFQEYEPEGVVYYSGHLPSVLRMNRTSSEFAVAVIFDGLLMSAIHFTDVHEASRQACCEDELISYLLEEIIPHLNGIYWGKATAKEMFLKSICDLIYNCCQSPSNVTYMMDNDLVDIYTVFRSELLDNPDARRVDMTMLLSLSYLIDDHNYDRIVAHEGCVVKLLQFLEKCLEHPEHTYYDFYAGELATCLNKLATHSSNRILIVKNEGQHILHKLLKYAHDDDERIAGLQTLWNLSFSREAKDVLRGMEKLMVMLRELVKSAEDNVVRKCANGVLWECEEKYDIQGTRGVTVKSCQHVMISYERDSYSLVVGIRDEIARAGFQVWMGSGEEDLYEVMRTGVEGAAIVLVAFTRKYKQEPHTFAELDYAHTLRKRIIPLTMETDLAADGWLTKYLQQMKTFDFSRRSMYNGSVRALVQYLKESLLPTTRTDANLSRNNVLCTEEKKEERSDDILAWNNTQVMQWLGENILIRKNNDGNSTDRLQKLTGFHLLMFYDLKKDTPDYYYSVLDSHLGFKDILDTLEFTYALDRLLGTEQLI